MAVLSNYVLVMRLISWTSILIVTVSPALAGWCDFAPPADKRTPPSVPFYDIAYPPDEMGAACFDASVPSEMIGACAYPVASPDAKGGIIWVIPHRDDLDDAEYECVIMHEKAHMPPNNWDHGPDWQSYLSDGQWRPAPGARWRRPAHVDPFSFVSGRVNPQ